MSNPNHTSNEGGSSMGSPSAPSPTPTEKQRTSRDIPFRPGRIEGYGGSAPLHSPVYFGSIAGRLASITEHTVPRVLLSQADGATSLTASTQKFDPESPGVPTTSSDTLPASQGPSLCKPSQFSDHHVCMTKKIKRKEATANLRISTPSKHDNDSEAIGGRTNERLTPTVDEKRRKREGADELKADVNSDETRDVVACYQKDKEHDQALDGKLHLSGLHAAAPEELISKGKSKSEARKTKGVFSSDYWKGKRVSPEPEVFGSVGRVSPFFFPRRNTRRLFVNKQAQEQAVSSVQTKTMESQVTEETTSTVSLSSQMRYRGLPHAVNYSPAAKRRAKQTNPLASYASTHDNLHRQGTRPTKGAENENETSKMAFLYPPPAKALEQQIRKDGALLKKKTKPRYFNLCKKIGYKPPMPFVPPIIGNRKPHSTARDRLTSTSFPHSPSKAGLSTLTTTPERNPKRRSVSTENTVQRPSTVSPAKSRNPTPKRATPSPMKMTKPKRNQSKAIARTLFGLSEGQQSGTTPISIPEMPSPIAHQTYNMRQDEFERILEATASKNASKYDPAERKSRFTESL